MSFRLNLPFSDLLRYGVNLDQYTGLWCIEPESGQQMLKHVQGMDLARHVREAVDGEVTHHLASVEAVQARARSEEQQISDGQSTANIAIVSLIGTMTKQGSSLSTAGSTVMARRALRQAATDRDVDGILVRLDTPGGTVAGTADFAADIAWAADRKPVFTFAEDLTASAGYWVFSQGQRAYANDKTALIGSIGTYMALYDLSKRAEQEGMEAIVISTGDMKGAGFPGTKITDEQKAYWQEIVDKTQAAFTAAVAQGRGMSEDDVPVTGRVYLAEDAQAMGLIDGIQSLDATIEELAEAAMREKREGARAAQISLSPQSDIAMSENLKQTKTNQPTAPQADADATPEASGSEHTIIKAGTLAARTLATSQSDSDDIEAMKAELAALKAQREADQERIAKMEAEQRTKDFQAFAHEHRRRILATDEQQARCVQLMEVLHAYDAVLAVEDEASALDTFKALVQSLPEQYSKTEVGLDAKDEQAKSEALEGFALPAGASYDEARLADVARVKAYAKEHGLTFNQAVAQLGNRVHQARA